MVRKFNIQLQVALALHIGFVFLFSIYQTQVLFLQIMFSFLHWSCFPHPVSLFPFSFLWHYHLFVPFSFTRRGADYPELYLALLYLLLAGLFLVQPEHDQASGLLPSCFCGKLKSLQKVTTFNSCPEEETWESYLGLPTAMLVLCLYSLPLFWLGFDIKELLPSLYLSHFF